jgi:hypothetical protein
LRPRCNRISEGGWRRFALVLAAALSGIAPSAAQAPAQDYAQPGIQAAAEAMDAARSNWRNAGKGMEEQVFRLPMSEARDRVQRVYWECMAYVEKRRAYSAEVAAYIESYHVETDSDKRAVYQEDAIQDQLEALGESAAELQHKLDSLREAPDWPRIRRAIQAERNQAMALQARWREEMPQDLSISSSTQTRPTPISAIVYRDSQKELGDLLERMWSKYYQALSDAIGSNSAASVPLLKTRGSAPAPVAPGAASAQSAAQPAAASALVGEWSYKVGSRQFNGVGEPVMVILELWMDQGALRGRYRAELPDFSGMRKLDWKLRAAAGRASGGQAMEFESADPPATGTLRIEGPAANGLEIMVVRGANEAGGFPRGREALRRR